MKKLTAIALILALMLSMAACSGGDTSTPEASDIGPAPVPESSEAPAEPTPEPEPSPEPTPEPVELTPSEGLVFELLPDGQGYELFWAGQCRDEVIVVPDTYEGLPVTAVAFGAFSMCRWVTHIYIPEGVTSIGDFAFEQCEKLVYVELPESLSYLGKKAFFRCNSLESIRLPDNVKSLEETFMECGSLKEVILPENIAWIGSNVFNTCPVESVVFQKYTEWSIMDVNWKEYSLSDPAAMADFFRLNFSTFSVENLYWTDEQGLVYGIAGDMDTYFYAYLDRTQDKTITDCSIPAEVHGLPLFYVESDAFEGCGSLSFLSFEQDGLWQKDGADVELSDPAANVGIVVGSSLKIPEDRR